MNMFIYLFTTFLLQAINFADSQVLQSYIFGEQLPPDTTPYWLQTNGPSASITDGDYWTASSGGNGYHYYTIDVPCTWDSRKIQIYLDDPWVRTSNSDTTSPDQLGRSGSQTTFEIYNYNVKVSAPKTPAPSASGSLFSKTYNARTSAAPADLFYTISSPRACGSYPIRVQSRNDDENSYRIILNYTQTGLQYDPSISISASTFEIPVSSDETACITQYVNIDSTRSSVKFSNYDLDASSHPTWLCFYHPDATYNPSPTSACEGGGFVGTPSGNGEWKYNTYSVGGSSGLAPGWWSMVVCTNPGNQFIVNADVPCASRQPIDRKCFFQGNSDHVKCDSSCYETKKPTKARGDCVTYIKDNVESCSAKINISGCVNKTKYCNYKIELAVAGQSPSGSDDPSTKYGKGGCKVNGRNILSGDIRHESDCKDNDYCYDEKCGSSSSVNNKLVSNSVILHDFDEIEVSTNRNKCGNTQDGAWWYIRIIPLTCDIPCQYCNDNNTCTTDTCVNGVCKFTPNTNACDDLNSCTKNDKCSNGLCKGTAKTCSDFSLTCGTDPCGNTCANCDDGNICTTDTCSSGSCQHVNNNLACDDSNSCTKNDVCTGGLCKGTAKTCTDLSYACGTDPCGNSCGSCASDNNVCTTDTCTAGVCSYPNNANNCDDSNSCTKNDKCSGGLCSGSPKTCTDLSYACGTDPCGNSCGSCASDNNVCTTDTCTAGVCSYPNNADNCDDSNSCTKNDKCSGGLCSGSPKTCTDLSYDCGTDPCGNSCGSCASDNNVCTTDTCTAGVCSYPNNADNCDDSNSCTKNDKCSGGLCSGSPKSCTDFSYTCGTDPCGNSCGGCNDLNLCTDDSCQSGTCHYDNNVLPCDDSNSCTKDDKCSGGSCSGSPKTCLDFSYTCGTDPCGNSCGGCDDNKDCTTDTCVSGTCHYVGTCSESQSSSQSKSSSDSQSDSQSPSDSLSQSMSSIKTMSVSESESMSPQYIPYCGRITGLLKNNVVAKVDCPANYSLCVLDFAGFGEVTGSCISSFQVGSCYDPNAEDIVFKKCIGIPSCQLPFSSFNTTVCGTAPKTDLALAIKGLCCPVKKPKRMGEEEVIEERFSGHTENNEVSSKFVFSSFVSISLVAVLSVVLVAFVIFKIKSNQNRERSNSS